ncbi:hypothetical protein ACET3Z_023840 [Daucus carota]
MLWELECFWTRAAKQDCFRVKNSGCRFLWVVKNSPHKGVEDDDENKGILALRDPDLSALLPQCFLERTKGRGLVVKVILVEELRAGLWLEESGGTRFVSSAEIEKRVKELMESENGNRIRHRVGELRDAAKVALSDENGSSC